MATKRYDAIQQQQRHHAAAAGLLHGLPRHPSLAATEAVAVGSPKFRARSGSKHGFYPGYLPPINTPFVPGSTDSQPTPGGGPFIPYPIGKGEAPWKQIFEKVRTNDGKTFHSKVSQEQNLSNIKPFKYIQCSQTQCMI